MNIDDAYAKTMEFSRDNKIACPRCGSGVLKVSDDKAFLNYTKQANISLSCTNCGLTYTNLNDDDNFEIALNQFRKGADEEKEPDIPMACNDNIAEFMEEMDLTEEDLIDDVANAFAGVLEALRIDTDSDHNTQETAKRVAKMYVQEIFKGRYQPMPRVTAFPNAKEYDQIYTVDEIEVRSTCAHHFQPIVGRAWVAIYPGDKVIGLSKFSRIIDWIASRPTIQEELVEQIADKLEEVTGAKGIMVVVKAEHGCCTNRGIKAHSSNMTTSVVRGVFKNEPEMKKEAIAMFQNFD